MYRSLGLAVALSCVASLAWPQIRGGPEFRVNEATTGQQLDLSISAAPTGEFVVVFTEPSFYPNGGVVWGQRYDAAGAPLGSNFRVSSTPGPSYGGAGRVEVAPDGRFLVVWQRRQALPAGQVFSPQGVRVGSEFTFGSTNIGDLAIARDGQGNFVVAWDAYTLEDPDYYGIAAQRIDRDGTPLGSPLSVNTWTTNFQLHPDVAVAANGDFIVAWNSYRQGGTAHGVFGQRFDAQGARRGAEFRISATTITSTQFPSIAADRDGAFVVAWESISQDGSGYGVFARRYASDGTPRGGEFRVNTTTVRDQMRPSVSGTADGDFIVTWMGDTTQFDSDVYAQRYDRSGFPLGAEFRVNSYTPFAQTISDGALVNADNFIVAWDGFDGSSAGVFGRRFFPAPAPAALAVDSARNGVLDPGETVTVAPSWLNATGAGVTFTGTASAFTGPGGPSGPSYTIPDPAADYGLVANTATGSCLATGDCYSLGVSTSSVRPAPHWDASFREELSTGNGTTWTVHVGDTFGDVLRTNPFYRFIETLLHRAVTSGCGVGMYCPASSTVREQMAVFVLAAKEGAGYQPPACTTPLFNDVPAASPYCRFIEELTRRGVVTGCGGGNYCPQGAVTREQMAVFVLRTLDPTLDPPACTTPVFNDVPASSPFCRWIEELVRRGVVTGCGAGSYCPALPVTREQMGAFISVTFGLTLYGP